MQYERSPDHDPIDNEVPSPENPSNLPENLRVLPARQLRLLAGQALYGAARGLDYELDNDILPSALPGSAIRELRGKLPTSRTDSSEEQKLARIIQAGLAARYRRYTSDPARADIPQDRRKWFLASSVDLSAEELIQNQAAGIVATEYLARTNLWLAVKTAHDAFERMPPHARRPPVDDLFQNCAVELVVAAERFRPRKDGLFSTYASHRLQDAISASKLNELYAVNRTLYDTARAAYSLERTLGYPPTAKELAAKRGVSPAVVVEHMVLYDAFAKILPLETPHFDDDTTTLADTIVSSGLPDSMEMYINPERAALLRARLGSVATPRERMFLIAKFGLDGRPPLSSKEMSQRFGGLSSSAATAVTTALRKLRADPELRKDIGLD